MAIVTKGRLYLPPEDATKPTERNVLHPETDMDSIIDEDGTTLKEYMGLVVQSTASTTDTNTVAKKNAPILVMEHVSSIVE